MGIHSFDSSQSIDTVKDKLLTQQILAENNLPIPKTMLVKFPVNVDLVERYLGFPVVVKTLSGSQGIGVFLIESKSGFGDKFREEVRVHHEYKPPVWYPPETEGGGWAE